MAFTNLNSSQITSSTVLKGGTPGNYLQVNSDNFNKLQSDVSNLKTSPVSEHAAQTAVNATAILTAAQVATGYITSTSAAAVTMTMPTGTLLGSYIGASQGTVLDLYIDNTAGANTVTVVVGTNAIASAWQNQLVAATASVTPAALTPLNVISGVTGQACFRLMFSSATAYTFTRIA